MAMMKLNWSYLDKMYKGKKAIGCFMWTYTLSAWIGTFIIG